MEAEKWLRQAVAYDPGNNWFAILLGNASRSAGNLTSAIEVYQQIISKHPNYDRAYLEIASAYHLLNQSEEAKTAIEKAISLAPLPDQWYYARAGVIFETAGEFDKALRYYYQALAIDPSNSSSVEGVDRLED